MTNQVSFDEARALFWECNRHTDEIRKEGASIEEVLAAMTNQMYWYDRMCEAVVPGLKLTSVKVGRA